MSAGMLVAVVLEGEKPVDAEPFIVEWLKAYNKQTTLVAEMARSKRELDVATTSYEEKRHAIQQQLDLQGEWRQQMNSIYAAVEQIIPTLNPQSFSTDGYKLHIEIQKMELDIQQHEYDKTLKSLESGFFAKIKHSIAAVGTELDIRALRKTIAAKQQQLARELLKQRHLELSEHAAQMDSLEQKLAASIKQTATLERERDFFKKAMNDEKAAWHTAKEELTRLQKSVYGLAHIE